MGFLLDWKLRSLAKRYGAEYVPLSRDATFRAEYQTLIRRLKDFAEERSRQRKEIERKIVSAYERSRNSDEVIQNLYDVEYSQDPGGNNYAYAAPLLMRIGFERIVGEKFLEDKQTKAILDVGAGSNEFLRFCNTKLGFSKDVLHGIDVSVESKNIIVRDGFHGYQGTLASFSYPSDSFDLVYLSYFIDYDTDQAGTFAAAHDLIKKDGIIVLEGWFPVRQFGLLRSDRDRHTYVTRGRSAEEDLELVIRAFELDMRSGKSMKCTRIVYGHRGVYSHYGLSKLPSFYLVFDNTST